MGAVGWALTGGGLIGLAASVLWFATGRVAGISGILAGAVLPGEDDRALRALFLGGLVAGGLLAGLALPGRLASGASGLSTAGLVAAGLLVGVGTRLGGGCTSGHGVCGLSHGRLRSLVATGVFMAVGAAAVFVVRHVAGGAA